MNGRGTAQGPGILPVTGQRGVLARFVFRNNVFHANDDLSDLRGGEPHIGYPQTVQLYF